MTSFDADHKTSGLIEFVRTGEGKGVKPLAFLRTYYENWSYEGFLTASLESLPSRLQAENFGELAELIERADLFVEGTYVFQNEWDMERTNIPEYFQLEDLKWDHNPFGDSEWMYMLNRQAFLVDVAMAFHITQNPKYLDYIEGFLEKWLLDNPSPAVTRQTSWRTIDAGLRVSNWVKVLEILSFSQAMSSHLFCELLVSVNQHLAFLTDELSLSRGQSNWSIIEITGIIIGALAFKEFDNSSDFLSKALTHLSPAISLQIEEDGIQREQSFMYHHEVLMCLLQVILIAERNHLELDPYVEMETIKMAKASALFIKPDGTQGNYGDSDSEDMIGILSVAEKILNRPFLTQQMSPKVSSLFEKLFIGIQPSVPIPERLTNLPSISFDNAGLYIMRSRDNRDYMMFKCGPLGGGHGHDDLLHLELYTQGRTVLVDSGRYSYDCDQNRLAYKEGHAHNTIIVDGQGFNRHQDSWDTTKVATPINQKRVSKDGAQFVEGGHLGYFDLADPVVVNRKVIYLSEGVWLVSDEISCQKEHKITSHFHFPQSKASKLTNQKVRYQDEQGEFTIETFNTKGTFDLQDCHISLQYNQQHVSQKASYHYQISGNHSLTYIMSNQPSITYCKIPVWLDEMTLLSDSEVECFRLDQTDKLSKYVLIQHREPSQGRRAYLIEGNYIYGRVSVIECESKGSRLNQITLY